MKKGILKVMIAMLASATLVMPVSAFAADIEEPEEEYVICTVEGEETDNDVEGVPEEYIGWAKYECNTDNVNVRSGPGTSYSSLGKLAKGTVVRVRRISDGWAKIKFGTQIGYVYAKYLTKL